MNVNLIAVPVAAFTGAIVASVFCVRGIRNAERKAMHWLSMYEAAEAQCSRLHREKRRAEEPNVAITGVYQRQIRELQARLDTNERLIRVLDCAVMHPSNRKGTDE